MATETDRAIKELKLAGLFDKDSDYGGMIGTAVKELLKVFQTQGHVKVKLSEHDEFVHFNCAVDENWVTETNYIKPVPSKHIHGRKKNDGYLFGLLNKIGIKEVIYLLK